MMLSDMGAEVIRVDRADHVLQYADGQRRDSALRDDDFTPAEITDLETSRAVAQLPAASDHQA
jgi:crotonobetainyl-CoA:carnitine CoA-transferase CaiB-like acyl-CoA transferase